MRPRDLTRQGGTFPPSSHGARLLYARHGDHCVAGSEALRDALHQRTDAEDLEDEDSCCPAHTSFVLRPPAHPRRSTHVPPASRVPWPDGAVEQARLLRLAARRMARDVRALGQAYASALEAAAAAQRPEATAGGGAPQETDAGGAAGAGPPTCPASGEQEGPAAVELADGEERQRQRAWRAALGQVKVAQGVACGAVERAFRALLYPVLVRELVTRVCAGTDE